MSETTHQIGPAAGPFIHRIWPQMIVGIALSTTVIWTFFLGYELVRLALVLVK
jgi:hypothetical protein